jgi:uncharacterized protein (TIGR02246 family)
MRRVTIDVERLYERLITAWNAQDADGMSGCFAADGTSIGFDGTLDVGRETIRSSMAEIFAHHPTPRYVSKVTGVRWLGADCAMLHAVSGIVPRGETAVNPQGNAHHTLIAEQAAGTWQVVLLQNTPAQFHGRPHLVAAMTAELQGLVGQLPT